MGPESPSPYPQVPATCPYPEPTPSSPPDPLQLPAPSTNLIYELSVRTSDEVFFFTSKVITPWSPYLSKICFRKKSWFRFVLVPLPSLLPVAHPSHNTSTKNSVVFKYERLILYWTFVAITMTPQHIHCFRTHAQHTALPFHDAAPAYVCRPITNTAASSLMHFLLYHYLPFLT